MSNKTIKILFIFLGIILSEKNNLYAQDDGFEMCSPYYDEELDKNIYFYPQVRAEFPGGEPKLLGFIMDNIEFQKQYENQGKFILAFIVDSDGSIQCAKVVKRTNRDCSHPIKRYEYKNDEECTAYDKEFLRIIITMIQWTPAKCDGENVASFVTLPIRFHPINKHSSELTK